MWTVKTMQSENGDVIKIDTTRRQTTLPWVSKMADRHYYVASNSRQFRGPIYWNAQASSSFDHAHWGYNSVFKQIRRCSVDGWKRYESDKCRRKSFWKPEQNSSVFVWKWISVDRASGERFRLAPFSVIVFSVVVWTIAVSGAKQLRFRLKTD